MGQKDGNFFVINNKANDIFRFKKSHIILRRVFKHPVKVDPKYDII